MKFTSITQRFVVWFLLISLLPIVLIGYSLLHTFEQELQQTVSRQISAIADKKADQIDAYLSELVRVALIKTQGHTTRMAMGDFTREFARAGHKSAAYQRMDASYRDYFRRLLNTTSYYDLFLISPQGTVVYSQTHEADFATNLYNGPYRNSGLAKVARNALSTLESGISEFEFYAPSGKAAAFVAVPFMHQGKVAGVLALQIDNSRVFQVLLDNTGLGDSGETVVARREDEHTALLMAPLKLDADAALKRRISLDDKQRAAPLLHALNGERGSALAIDYSGRPVVAAWSYLPRMGWGMVTKVDATEAFAPLYRVRSFAVVVLGLALVAALAGAIILGRRVIAPLQSLTNGAQDIAVGKLDQRIPVVRRDELGQLAASFNTMAERLQSAQDELEGQVRQRTFELAQSMANLHIKNAAIASSINAIVIAGLDGKLSYVNQAFAKMWLLRLPEDAIGRSPVEFFEKPEEAQAVMEVLWQQGRWQGELNARLNDGTDTLMYASAHMMLDETGNPLCMMASFMDISEKKRVAEMLAEKERLVQKAQETAHIGDFKLDIKTSVVEGSDELFRIFGVNRDEFLFSDFAASVHPDCRAMVESTIECSIANKTGYDIEHALLLRDGTRKFVRAIGEMVLDSNGSVKFMIGTVQDITARKLNELRLNEAQRLARVGSWDLDLLTGKLEWSDEIFSLFEIDKGRFEATYEAFLNAIHPDDRDMVNQAYTDSLQHRKPYEIAHRLQMSDGRIKWVQELCETDFNADGKPLFSRGTVQDITERKHAEEILRNANEELERRVELRTVLLQAAKEEAEQANNSKSVFLSSMSHELRTPLNAILGYAQLMQIDTSLPQSVVENANEIKRAGDVLLSLMNDILDLSRIESGTMHLEPEIVPLSGVINDCRAQNIQAAKSRNVNLHMAGSCAAYQVVADKRGLLQVLNNLVSNAIKYNREGGRVNVSCAVDYGTVEMHGKVKISVMDTGLGIAADKQSQLFQSFNRLGAEMSNIEGTGIGLVISRKLIEAMQGVIGVETIHGLGSTFWVELPLAKQPDSASPMAATGQPPASSRRVPQVLVAEDYAPNQNVLLLQLQTMGCEVDIAAEGVAALKMWRNKPYDLILTDIDMPVMNGTEFARAVRNEERTSGGRIPIIAITATSTTSELKRYQLAGIDEVLGKPLSMDILRNGLMRWLGDFSAAPSILHAHDTVHAAANGTANAVLDINFLYKILGQVNLVQARILVDTFMRTADEGLQALGSQVDNLVAVAKEMHKQKSSARTVGALHYANLAATLEQQTKDKQFKGIASSLAALRKALTAVETAAANLLETQSTQPAELTSAALVATRQGSVHCHSALVVDDDMVVLQQVKTMLAALGVKEILTAVNGVDATRVMAERGGEIEVLVCDLSMPEMDGVELIRSFGKTGFKGGVILISGAEEKIISTVNKLAVLQGLRVLGQLQKPVSAAQLAILLSHTADLPSQNRPLATGPVVSKEAISAAMAANEFSIWFQPKVEAISLRVVGMEALARWQLPGGKFIPPDNFITVAEREGLIGELSQLLVSVALAEAAKLFAAGFPLKVAINLSGTWLNDLSLPEFILSKTRAAGLQAADVILEVTETGVMEDLTTALDVLSRLRLKGFGLSIDDFGIGYSSFEQLGLIPFTEMKLDRSFVSKGVGDAAARAILESSMDMAHKLNLSTVAEGVETELDLKLVRSLGCNLVQGYLIAKPMPVKDLLVWLENAKNMKKN